MINNVVLTGRLTRDLDLKYTQSGTAVGSFSVAVERDFKNAQGERETDFINCVIWRKSAENLAKFTKKGSLVGLEGKIQTRNYENNQGQRVYVTEVVIDNFSLLESKKDREQNNGVGYQNNGSFNQQGGFNQPQNQNNSPFNGQQAQGNGFGGNHQQDGVQGGFGNVNGTMQFDESDMPF